MKKYFKQFKIVLLISSVLSFVVFLLIFLLTDIDILPKLILSFIGLYWSFLIIPSFIYIGYWVEERFDFREGVFLGIILKNLIFVLPMFFAPVWGIKYFIMINKKIKGF